MLFKPKATYARPHSSQLVDSTWLSLYHILYIYMYIHVYMYVHTRTLYTCTCTYMVNAPTMRSSKLHAHGRESSRAIAICDARAVASVSPLQVSHDSKRFIKMTCGADSRLTACETYYSDTYYLAGSMYSYVRGRMYSYDFMYIYRYWG